MTENYLCPKLESQPTKEFYQQQTKLLNLLKDFFDRDDMEIEELEQLYTIYIEQEEEDPGDLESKMEEKMDQEIFPDGAIKVGIVDYGNPLLTEQSITVISHRKFIGQGKMTPRLIFTACRGILPLYHKMDLVGIEFEFTGFQNGYPILEIRRTCFDL